MRGNDVAFYAMSLDTTQYRNLGEIKQRTNCSKYEEGILRKVWSYLEAVANAVMRAGDTPIKYVNGFFLANIRYINGSTTKAWTAKPTITVSEYMPICWNVSSQSSIPKIFPKIKKKIPTGEHLPKITGTDFYK